jgi:hypothetical protein
MDRPPGGGGIRGDGSEGDDAVEDRRKIVVLVDVPVEAPAVHRYVEAGDSPAAGRHPKYRVCSYVANDGDLVHEDAFYSVRDDGGTAVSRTPAGSCLF